MTAPRSRAEQLAAERAALAATRAELAGLADPPVPPELARRWSAAIEAELASTTGVPGAAAAEAGVVAAGEAGPPPQADPVAPDEGDAGPERPNPSGRARRGAESESGGTAPAAGRSDGQPPRPGRRRRPLWRRPALVAAALLAAVVAAASLARTPAPAVGPPTLAAEAQRSVGVHDAGGFEDPARRAGCLRALGLPAAAPLVGGRRVTYDGRDGVLLVLGSGRRGVFDIVVVDPTCSALLATAHIGR